MEPAPKRKSYACRHCPKTFPTSMALAGHYNAHKNKRVIDKQHETAQSFLPDYTRHQPYITTSLTPPFSIRQPSENVTSKMSYPWPSGDLSLFSSFPSYSWPAKPQEFTPFVTIPDEPNLQPKTSELQAGKNSNRFFGVYDFFGSAPVTSDGVAAAGESNKFFGVPDFFGPCSSAPRTTISNGAGTRTAPIVKNVETPFVLVDSEVEEKYSEIDLNLKL